MYGCRKSAVSDTSLDVGAVFEVRDHGDDKLKVSLEHCCIAHMFNSITHVLCIDGKYVVEWKIKSSLSLLLLHLRLVLDAVKV